MESIEHIIIFCMKGLDQLYPYHVKIKKSKGYFCNAYVLPVGSSMFLAFIFRLNIFVLLLLLQ